MAGTILMLLSVLAQRMQPQTSFELFDDKSPSLIGHEEIIICALAR
jgi:hypothetical protein